MRCSRYTLLPLATLSLIAACEPTGTTSVETPPRDSTIIIAHDHSHIFARWDSTLIYVNGVPDELADFDRGAFEIVGIRRYRGAAAVERYGAVAEGKIVVDITMEREAVPVQQSEEVH